MAVRDREYVLFAKVPGDDRFLQIAGWDPTINAPADPPPQSSSASTLTVGFVRDLFRTPALGCHSRTLAQRSRLTPGRVQALSGTHRTRHARDLLAIQPDPVTFDHVAVAEPIEAENRIRAIATEEHHTLIVRA
jgi:hypothetical protein